MNMRLGSKKNRAVTRLAEYFRWRGMLSRCNAPNRACFKNYGGRGITVCERWKSFDNFLSDMGPLPTKQHTLDRIRNNEPYGPTNCKWSTRREQARNRRCNIWVGAFGVSMLAADWATTLGVVSSTMTKWLKRYPNLTLEEILLIV